MNTTTTQLPAPSPARALLGRDGCLHAHIGTLGQGGSALWQLTDPDGSPSHGLVTGWSGAGASVLFSHILAAAAQAGLSTWYLDSHDEPRARAATRFTTHAAAFAEELEGEMAARKRTLAQDGRPEPLLVVLDHPRALREQESTWTAAAARGRALGIGVIVRVPDLAGRPVSSTPLRAMAAHTQYLAFDLGAATPVMRNLGALLPGYTAPGRGPARTIRPGHGHYGRHGHSTRVRVFA